jgi:hypothetical protein
MVLPVVCMAAKLGLSPQGMNEHTDYGYGGIWEQSAARMFVPNERQYQRNVTVAFLGASYTGSSI